jgi:hypothetical protein
MEKFKACGGTLATQPRTFPKAGYSADTSETDRYAVEAMQAFQQAGVTTVVWPGGLETKFSKAAANLNYHPEWILAGDGFTDNDFANQGYRGSTGQDQSTWANAAVVSYQPLIPVDERTRVCFQALRSVDPNVPQQDAVRTGCDTYDNLRQLFIGVQVAGPRLGPTSIDRGFHAIPAIASTDLQIPACYYDPGDYTCVKDFIIGRWDPQGAQDTSGQHDQATPGCYRVVASRRIILADVDHNNAMDGYNPAFPDGDPCNGFGGTLQFNPGAPDPNDL